MDVLAALARCATAADHYRVQIDAENLLAPLEVDALRAAPIDQAARPWVDRLAVFCDRVARARQPFRRRDLAATATLYEGAGAPGAPRILVVAFTGVGHRLMMPVAPLLQALPADRCDVVVLRDTDRDAFLRGVPGYAPDLPALVARLAADVPWAGHAGIRSIGTSIGGAAALAFGALAGARLALSLGGGHPIRRSLRAAGPRRIDPALFGRLVAAAPAGTRLVCAHGADHATDRVRSRLLAMAVPGSRVLVVEGVAEHAVLGGLLARGRLARFLEEILLADALPADGVWRP